MNKKEYTEEINNRIGFYVFLSQKPEIMFDKLEVYTHKDKPNQHFIYIKYRIHDEKDEKLITYHEEIETFLVKKKNQKQGWKCIFNQDESEKLNQFLKAVKLSDFKTDHVKVR